MEKTSAKDIIKNFCFLKDFYAKNAYFVIKSENNFYNVVPIIHAVYVLKQNLA